MCNPTLAISALSAGMQYQQSITLQKNEELKAKRQNEIAQLDTFDPLVNHPEIAEFWDNNIESGTFTTEIKNFKRQNNINSLEDLLDLYDNNPNSMWASPQDLIDQIKKCNL